MFEQFGGSQSDQADRRRAGLQHLESAVGYQYAALGGVSPMI